MDKKFKRSFIKSSITTSVGQVVTIGVQFISLIIIVRSTSKEIFGLYTLVLAVSAIMKLIAGMGLELTLIREFSNVKSSDGPFYSILILRTFILVIVSGLFLLVAEILLPVFDPELIKVKFLILFICFLWSHRELSLSYIQGIKAFRTLAVTQVTAAVIKLSFYFAALLVYGSYDLEILIFIEILYLSIALIIQYVSVPEFFKQKIEFRAKNLIRLLKFGIPIYFTSILDVINNRANTFIIAVFLTPASIASYVVPHKLPQAMGRLFIAFNKVFFPNVSQLFSENKRQDAQRLIYQSLYIFSILLSVAVAIVYIFKDEIIIVVFSSNYLDSSLALSIFVLSFLFRTQKNVIGYSFVADGHPKLSLKIDIQSITTGVLTSLLLVPKIGFMGAVYGVLVHSIISAFLSYYYLNQINIKINILSLLKPIFVCVFFCIIYSQLNIVTIYIKASMAVIFIATYYFWFKKSSSTIIKILRSIIKRSKPKES